MTKMLMVVALVAGCAVEAEPGESAVEQDLSPPTGTVSNYCTPSGGYNWCQDFYTGKWCTNARTANGWDLTYCNWSGWNDQGNYCGNPRYYPDHEWAQGHLHCD
jgi:hypothetical protein